MELFKKKPKVADRNRLELELVSGDSNDVHLAFGLQWSSIVAQGSGRDSAIKLVKQRKATHFLYRNQQVGFGVIDLKKNSHATQGQIYPAAQVAARQYGGDAIHVIKVGEGEYWLGLINNSQPTSVDQFIFADNDSVVVEEAQRIIDAGRDEGKTYSVYTNLTHHNFGMVRRNSVEDLLMATGSVEDAMEALPRGGSLNLPKPVLYSILVVAALIAAQSAWKYKVKQDEAKAARLALPAAGEPPEVAWARAVTKWESTKAKARVDGLLAIRETVGSIPVRWNGWNLSGAKCSAGELTTGARVAAVPPTSPASGATEPVGMVGSQRTWSCTASYDRSKVGSFNKDMEGVIPKGWNVRFMPLNKMQATWSITEMAEPLKIAELKTIRYHLVDTVSKLQKVAPGFSQDMNVAFAPVAIPAPKKPDGTAYAADPTASGLQSAEVAFKGPLRSMDHLTQAGIEADWTSISITAATGAPADKSAGINQSALTAEVTGVIYAKNN